MVLEVEIKARCRDRAGVEKRLADLGATFDEEVTQEDAYYTCPWRDFRKTDEALRVRAEEKTCYVTYKGPKIDAESKTREEINVDAEAGMNEVFKKLGFNIAGIIRKTRGIYRLGKFTLSLDDVDQLGCYVEIESDDLADKEEMFSLISQLGMSRDDCTTKSYLELFSEQASENPKDGAD